MFKVLLGVSRWNFLSLTLLTIALAAVTARYQGVQVQQLQLALVLLLGRSMLRAALAKPST